MYIYIYIYILIFSLSLSIHIMYTYIYMYVYTYILYIVCFVFFSCRLVINIFMYLSVFLFSYFWGLLRQLAPAVPAPQRVRSAFGTG